LDKADDPRATSDTPFDRFLRFGTALFAVKKDELPKRAERARPSKKKRQRPGAAGS
jgi:hypothetical protein